MKKLHLLIVISAFFSASMAFSLDNRATQASKRTPINVLVEQQKLTASMEQNNEDEGAQESGEDASEQDLYQIELLVFAYVNTGEENSEIWRNPKRPDFAEFKKYLNDKPENHQSSAQKSKRQNLSAIIQHKQKQEKQKQNIERHFLDADANDVSQFESIMRKMTINGHYRTLKHLIWQQQVMPKEAQDFFYLQGGENYLTEAALFPMDNTDSSFNKPTYPAAPYLNQGSGVPELEGTLHIYRSRFLHVIPDLWFTQFAPNDAGQCLVNKQENHNTNPSLENPETTAIESYTPLINFNLNQRRRLRSGELHYLDHPRFGVLIVFNKVVEEKETIEDTNIEADN